MEQNVITTKYGQIRGKYERGMYGFLNIPYAQYERFCPPKKVEPWEGIRDCTTHGHVQYQQCPPVIPWKGWEQDEFSEDKGLNLNVWTPACDGKKREVLVWIHGGGNLEGSITNPAWEGPNIAGGHDIVFVNISYRLGLWGTLYLGDLLGEKYQYSGSLITLDKIAALEWVKENISDFGGDPENVTIMGQSGGAKSVGNLIVCPKAKGLFKKAILISGCAHTIHDLKTAKMIRDNFLESAGIKPEDAKELLTMSAEKFMELQVKYRKGHSHSNGPTIDGVTFMEHPLDYIASGKADHLEAVYIGYTREESGGYWTRKSTEPEKRRASIRSRLGKNADHVIKAYYDPALKENAEYEAYRVVLNHFNYANESVTFAEALAKRGIKTYCYRWGFEGGKGPVHLTDLSYYFRTNEENDPHDHHPAEFDYMSEVMNTTLIQFVKTGDPNNQLIPEWKPYTDPNNGTRMYFSENTTAEPFSLEEYDHEFEFLEYYL